MKSIQPSRRDFGSGGIFPDVKTPAIFKRRFPTPKRMAPANRQPMRSLLNGAWAIGGLDATTMPRRWRCGGKGSRMKRGGFRVFRGWLGLFPSRVAPSSSGNLSSSGWNWSGSARNLTGFCWRKPSSAWNLMRGRWNLISSKWNQASSARTWSSAGRNLPRSTKLEVGFLSFAPENTPFKRKSAKFPHCFGFSVCPAEIH
jgi:hypothetical protein